LIFQSLNIANITNGKSAIRHKPRYKLLSLQIKSIWYKIGLADGTEK